MKILNAGGATRYDTINSNLSHILIGSPSKKDIKMLQTIPTELVFERNILLLYFSDKRIQIFCFFFHFEQCHFSETGLDFRMYQ